jgi:dTDP-4-dehydrorhamnose 3,5-epimerase
MNVIKTAIPDVMIIEPKVFGDARGFFTRVSISVSLKN